MQDILLEQDWRWVLRQLSAVADLEASARAYGAIRRVRKVQSAGDLLRLGLMYGPGRLSLRGVAAMAADGAVVELSDKGVLGRLRKMGDWLEYLLARLFEARRGLNCEDGLVLSLVDGSVICAPGAAGAAWRLHARFDPARGRFADLVLTSGKQAERVERTHVEPGSVVVQDRGYARVRDFKAVLASHADFITRIGWRAVRLHDEKGAALDLLPLLPAHGSPVEHCTFVTGLDRPVRLVIQRLPPEQVERQRQRVHRRASKKCHKLDARTVQTAAYLIVLSSLPAERYSAQQILAMYRDRWQIELSFKRLKTLGGLDDLPAFDPALARTWLLAHMIAAVLTDDIATDIAGFSP